MEDRVTISRSRDYALLWRIASSPEIFRVTSDDFSPAAGCQPRLPMREDCIYLMATQEPSFSIGGGDTGGRTFTSPQPRILGFVVFFPVNGVTYESHLCFLSRGPVNQIAFRQMLGWMWANTRAERICGGIPDFNRAAIKFVEKCGFTEYGVNPQSWSKNRKLHDLVLYGISRPFGSSVPTYPQGEAVTA